jgi:PadR family transcriptional regulator, regulatory protein AphA
MARVNPTEFAILGLLAEAPSSGYDIKREVEERLSHFWSESFGHIYPMLRRLDQKGLVEKSVQRQSGKPDRKVYAITPAGRDALEGWFAEPPAPQRPRNELLLRLFFGRHTSPDFLIRDVRAQREGFEAALAQLRAVRDRLEANPDPQPDRLYWELTLSYGVEAFEALIRWGRAAEDRLGELPDTEGSEGDGT